MPYVVLSAETCCVFQNIQIDKVKCYDWFMQFVRIYYKRLVYSTKPECFPMQKIREGTQFHICVYLCLPMI